MNYRSLQALAFAGIALLVVAGLIALRYGDELNFVSFAYPWWWLALLPLAAILGWRVAMSSGLGASLGWGRGAARGSLLWSRAKTLSDLRPGWATYVADLPNGLRIAAMVLLIAALARPQSTRSSDHMYHEGIDIAVAVDLSESMAAQDLPPSRLEAAKAVLDAFITRRPHDRIAMVAFGQQASTLAPLTLDHGVLRRLVRRIRLNVMDGSSTAIGAGIGMALNRLQESDSETRIIVLLTDGVQTADGLHPDAVAQEAASRGVKIFTILIGRHDDGSVDPAQLERLAAATGGFAYTASDARSLETSFIDLLDRLETSKLEGEQVRAELFAWFLWPALILLALDLVLRNTRLRTFP